MIHRSCSRIVSALGSAPSVVRVLATKRCAQQPIPKQILSSLHFSNSSNFTSNLNSQSAQRPYLKVRSIPHHQKRKVQTMAAASSKLELEIVDIDNPKELNFILGHSHFIKTVEDLYEALVQSGMAIKFGLAFCEASGDRKVRSDGNDDEMINLAKQNAMKLGAGHSFIIFMDKAYPVSVLNAVKGVPEVCRVHCATANPTSVVVAKLGEERKGILGVIDGFCPVDYENEHDKQQRHDLLRAIGYKR